MSELLDLVVLARVVARGSFARAATELGVPPSTLSRKVAALERRLGVRVLERTTRSLRVTEVGALLAERGERIHRELDDAARAVADHQGSPRGVLRLSVPTPLASDALAPVVADYLRAYPDVRVEVVASDRVVDLVDEGFDAAIRFGALADSSLGAIRLGAIAPVLAASRAYLDRAPPLRHPRDLAGHVAVGFGTGRKATWRFVRGDDVVAVEVPCRAVATSAPLAAQLAAAGIGITVVPPVTATTAGLDVLEPGGFRPRASPLHLVTPSAQSMPPKLRAFVAMLRAFVARRADLFGQA